MVIVDSEGQTRHSTVTSKIAIQQSSIAIQILCHGTNESQHRKDAMFVTLMMAMLVGAKPAALAADEQFSVYAPSQEAADAVLSEAQRAYREIANEWLSSANTKHVRTIIYIKANSEDAYGKSILVQRDSKRRCNIIWIHSRDDRDIDAGTLWHEIAHCVLADRFQGALATAIHEGCAARYDSGTRKQLIRQTTTRLAESKTWGSIIKLLESDAIDTSDVKQYATSIAIVEFLLSQGDREKLLRFGAVGTSSDWEIAIRKHYRYQNMNEFDAAFAKWAHQKYGSQAMISQVNRK